MPWDDYPPRRLLALPSFSPSEQAASPDSWGGLRSGGGQSREGKPGTPNPATFLHATGLLHLESEGRAEQSGDRVAVMGLGRPGPESAHSRGWCCPSPSGRLTSQANRQPGVGVPGLGSARTKRPQNSSGPGRPAGVLSCRAAEPPPASRAPSPPSLGEAVSRQDTFGRCQARPPRAPRRSLGLSLANFSSSWMLRGSPALAPGGRLDGGPCSGFYLARVVTARKEDSCPPRLLEESPLRPRLGLAASPPRTAEQGRDGGGGPRVEEGILRSTP